MLLNSIFLLGLPALVSANGLLNRLVIQRYTSCLGHRAIRLSSPFYITGSSTHGEIEPSGHSTGQGARSQKRSRKQGVRKERTGD